MLFGSMSMDEFLANIWSSDVNYVDSQLEFPVQNKNSSVVAEEVEPLLVAPPICKKTVEEVWSEIRKEKRPQQNEEVEVEGKKEIIKESESLKRQQTLGEMTLEDFLVKAGVVQHSCIPFHIPSEDMSMRDHNGVLDGGYKMDSCSQQNVGDVKCGREGESSRKKRIIDGPPQVVIERRQRRMLKNRESAARSRARRQAYTVELEAGLSQLRQENERLKEILAEAEKKRKQEIARKKHATNNKAQKLTDKFKAMRRTSSAAW